MIREVLGVSGVIGFGIIWSLLGLLLSAISLTITLTIVYFFLAAAGVVPPLDFVPFVPYI